MRLIDTFFNFRVFAETLPLLLRGLWVTIELGVVSIILGLLLGLFLALQVDEHRQLVLEDAAGAADRLLGVDGVDQHGQDHTFALRRVEQPGQPRLGVTQSFHRDDEADIGEHGVILPAGVRD